MNETAAMARKAARGAGYSWGMADEAAAAVRWVSSFGMDGCAALAHVLRATHGNVTHYAPGVAAPVWRAQAGSVCPLSAGVALTDRAFMLVGLRTRIENVLAPVLLLPFAADAARTLGQVMALKAGDQEMQTDGKVVSGYPLPMASDVDIGPGSPLSATLPGVTRVEPDVDAWETLSAFAELTYAPASEASRRLGAGADTTDND